MRNIALLLFCCLFASAAWAQSFVKVEVLSGSSETTCTDNNSGPDNLWGVKIGGDNYAYYAPSGFCELNAPNLQYDQSYACGDMLPDSIEVCFTALEFDGFSYCFVSGECQEEICMNFPVPTFGKTFHNLELPIGGASEGGIEFSIAGFQADIPAYDEICGAIDLGIILVGDTIGDANQGIYHNHCTSNIGEIDTYPLTGWFNNNGIWITFTTGPEETPYIDLILKSDPEDLGDPVSFQTASFFSDNDACDGVLDYYVQYFDGSAYDETMIFNCIPPNTTFYILVDGVNDDPETLQGIFGLSIEAYDATVAANDKCDAFDFGQIPEAGQVFTNDIQVNRCADAAGEPTVPLFDSDRTVWYSFITPSSGNVVVEAYSDPNKEPLDIELALFSSSDNTCSGTFQLEKTAYDVASFDETLIGSCLEPNTRYWLLVDGETDNQKGCFTLNIYDAGVIPTFFTQTETLCSYESFDVGSSIYNTSGVYLDTFVLPNGCDSILESTLLFLPPLNFSLIEIQEATALGIDDAEIELICSGGTNNLTISWDDGNNSFTRDDLVGGDEYCFTISDDFGCSLSDCITAPFNNDIVPVVNVQDVECYGVNSGVINIAAFNGSFPYDVLITGPNGVNESFQLPFDNIGFELLNLFAGTYNCTISDSNSSINFDIDVNQNDSLSYTIANELPISCYGLCDGLVEVAIAGGVQPYFYAWETGSTQAEQSNLCAGVFDLSVTDFLGCNTVFEIEIMEPDSIDGDIQLISDVDCKGESNGALAYVTTDNSLSFNWSNGPMTFDNNDIGAGVYSVLVSDAFGCSKELFAEVNEPLFKMSGEILEVSPIKCFEDQNGVLTSVIIGGNEGYQYNWSSGQDMATIEDLGTGTYSLTVVDEKGCELLLDYELQEPALLEAAVTWKDVQCSDTDFGGSIFVEYLSGGTGMMEYSIDGFFFQEADSFGMLAPGVYEVIMQDSNKCQWVDIVEISSPDPISLTLEGPSSIVLGESLQLTANPFPADLGLEWYINNEIFDCTDCGSLQLGLLESSLFTVIATDSSTNCSVRAELDVEVQEDLDLFFPNVFSPNNDGINDFFYPVESLNTALVKSFEVYDRYGQLLFRRTDFEPGVEELGWNGMVGDKALDAGVYTFFANMEYINGKEVLFKGAVTLIR